MASGEGAAEAAVLGVPGASPEPEPPKMASPPPSLAARLESYKKASPEEVKEKLEEKMAAAVARKEAEVSAVQSKAERFEKGLPGTSPVKGGADAAMEAEAAEAKVGAGIPLDLEPAAAAEEDVEGKEE